MARTPTEEERRAAVDAVRQEMRMAGVSTAASDEDLLRGLGDRVAIVGAKELERRAAGLPLASDYPHRRTPAVALASASSGRRRHLTHPRRAPGRPPSPGRAELC